MISLHSSVLLNLMDHMLRGSESRFGALLGVDGPDGITVHNSFEIATDNQRSVDTVYLRTRLEQFHTVAPEYALKGVYSISDSGEIDDSFKSVVNKVKDFTSNFYNNSAGLVVMSIKESNITLMDSDMSPFVCYSESFEKILPVNFVSTDTEQVVANTASNYKNYSTPGSRLSFSGNNGELGHHVKDLSASVHHLRKKLIDIFTFVETNTISHKSAEIMEINREIVYLANKVRGFKSLNVASGDHLQHSQLQSTHLSILINQINSLRNVNMNIQKQLSKTKILPHAHNI